ncbi:MAG: replication initiation protein [Thermus sp.]|uniref:replication initiation protein n=1 Tax=Thermus sp. TaxID=275 RepID=UPI003918D698
MQEQNPIPSGFPGPETLGALVKILELKAKDPGLAERALRALAAKHGLTPEALLAHLSRREAARRAFQEAYLALFRERLPRKPYAADDPRQGTRILPLPAALRRAYLQVGHYPGIVFRLAFDLDTPLPEWEERTASLPPSLVLVNPGNGHAHAWYELEHPVVLKGENEAFRSLLSDTEALLEAYLGADPGYAGLLARNPLTHPREWVWGGGKLWSLSDLLSELRSLVPRRVRAQADPALSGYGRNNTLFDRLRYWAYSQVHLYRGKPGGEEAFRNQVLRVALSLNQELFRDHPKGPLSPQEVRYTAKSVAKWTYRHYRGGRVYYTPSTGNPDRSRLSRTLREAIPPLPPEEQERERKKAALANNAQRRQEAEAKLVEALKRLQARGERITATALAKEAGVNWRTASAWLKRMRE